MISIVVCSANEVLFRKLSQNISETAGIPFEIYKVDNAGNRYGIAEAYNKGVAAARFDLTCFVHEDVQFETQNWGPVLLDLFKDSSVGLVGIAGARYYSLPPIGWFNLNVIESNYIQHFKDPALEPVHQRQHHVGENKSAEVCVIDGVFMACRKELAAKNPFDSKNLPGFHGYDIDFSLQLGSVSRVIVTKEILLHHFSEGNLGPDWYEAMRTLARKWEKYLPAHVPGFSPNELKKLALDSLNVFFYFSSRYFNRVKRARLYFYYAWKLGMIIPALLYFCKFSFKWFAGKK